MTIPCPKGCGARVHPENLGFHVCRPLLERLLVAETVYRHNAEVGACSPSVQSYITLADLLHETAVALQRARRGLAEIAAITEPWDWRDTLGACHIRDICRKAGDNS